MNKATNEQLDRYLFGEMPPAEQQQFLAEAASDPETARAIAAEQRIEETLRADRNSIPDNHALTRKKMLALAAATPAADGGASGGTHGGGAGAASQGAWLGKMIVGAVAAIGVVGGIIWLASPGDSQEATNPAPAVQTAPQAIPPAPPQLHQPPPAVNSQQQATERATVEQPAAPPAATPPPARAKNPKGQPAAQGEQKQPSQSQQPPVLRGQESKVPNSTMPDPTIQNK
ncbi:MAG: hypothetical protein IPM61_16025 [Chlorobi bacterium]|nr:hypothetical protein [Chlorobiota bacterium]MBX7217575.1 hypothetical protein [Candidatus Kapabacteria bacterium]